MTDRVTIDISNGVADVRLNRADKLNALDKDMFDGLIAAGNTLRADPSVRAVVLSGNGRGFCAGLDFMSFMALGDGDPSKTLLRRDDPDNPANYVQQAAYTWTTLPMPVIAALHGVVFGGGFQIALGADIRFIAPDAQMSVMEIRWGLIPDMSGTQTLRRLVRLDVAKELTFTGRKVPGDEAVALGLATHVSTDPLAEAMAMAQDIASKSPDAIRAGKRLLHHSGLVSEAEGLLLEEEIQLTLLGTANQMEAVQANMQKRPPEFTDPDPTSAS